VKNAKGAKSDKSSKFDVSESPNSSKSKTLKEKGSGKGDLDLK